MIFMNKRTMVLAGLCFLMIFFQSQTVSAQSFCGAKEEGRVVEPLGDKRVWRYTIINGKKYKRLWSETKKKWLSDWILIS